MISGRSPDAALSPAEVSLLRRLSNNSAVDYSNVYQDRLVSMGLIQSNLPDGYVLTELGKRRLQLETTSPAVRS